MKGEKGLPGVPGRPGRKGPIGDSGPRGQKGFKGEPGGYSVGLKGLPGSVGEPGRDGEKGRIGDDGQPGLNGFKGQPGIYGLPGSDGIPGDCGEEGNPGAPGFDGLIGRKGIVGDIGDRGSYGREGLKGTKGLSGDSGELGIKGQKGDPGPIGDKGITITSGDKASQGAKGVPGLFGPPGHKGDNGIKGDMGQRGFPGEKGLPGIPGQNGRTGQAGLTGDFGMQGPDGPIGEKGYSGSRGQDTLVDVGYVFTRHSQTTEVPRCPLDTVKLWEGYSLVNFHGNARASGQELGSSGSCLPMFSTLPLVRCNIRNECSQALNQDNSYWLSTSEPMTSDMNPISGNRIRDYISRCSVCESIGNVIAVHSQNESVPECPSGWAGLWTGFSFIMNRAEGAEGSGQNLLSPGSCLEEFNTVPYIECKAAGHCNKYSTMLSFWLFNIGDQSDSQQFSPSVQYETLKVGNNIRRAISRCKVCTLRESLKDQRSNYKIRGYHF